MQVIGNSRIEGLNVSLVQLDGKVLFQEKAAGQETLIPITHLAQGMYILVLQDIESKRISTQKIILQR